MKERISLMQALFIIIGSMIIISGSSFWGYYQHKQWKAKQFTDDKYNIKYINQRSLSDNVLDTQYLAEIIGLSLDNKENFYKFDIDNAKEKLNNSSHIKHAEIKKEGPDSIYIEYLTKDPIAKIHDVENYAMDAEGNVFLYEPFFKNLNIPKIFFGNLNTLQDVNKLEGKNIDLAVKLLKLLSLKEIKESFKINLIDMSKTFNDSYGKREIVISLEDTMTVNNGTIYVFPKILRLNCVEYTKQLSNFLELNNKMKNDYTKQVDPNIQADKIIFSTKVIDMRISQLAFIDE